LDRPWAVRMLDLRASVMTTGNIDDELVVLALKKGHW
jgi:hypothetical protein